MPTGLFTTNVNAAENVPQYLKYSELYFTSVSQYNDNTLVTYKNTKANTGESFTQLSSFKNGKETNIAEYQYALIDSTFFDRAYYVYYDGSKWSDFYYNLSTGTLSKDCPNFYENETVSDTELKNILDKINKKYNKNYTMDLSNFSVTHCKFSNGNTYFEVYYKAGYSEELGKDL